MSCIWQGSISSMVWPRHGPDTVDLPVEMWSIADYAPTAFANADLQFDKFVSIGDVPPWTICGPEFTVLTRCSSSLSYFSEFSLVNGVAIRVRISNTTPAKSRATHFILFAVRDERSTKISARSVNADVRVPTRVDTTHVSAKPSAYRQAANPNSHFIALSKPPDIPQLASEGVPSGGLVANPVVDIKKAVQQTVMGALRLRGIRSSSPEFKKLYFSVLYLVELALQKLERHMISMHLIHDKVEAILTVLD